jgi:hypothetical protein
MKESKTASMFKKIEWNTISSIARDLKLTAGNHDSTPFTVNWNIT